MSHPHVSAIRRLAESDPGAALAAIDAALRASGGHRGRASKRLGISQERLMKLLHATPWPGREGTLWDWAADAWPAPRGGPRGVAVASTTIEGRDRVYGLACGHTRRKPLAGSRVVREMRCVELGCAGVAGLPCVEGEPAADLRARVYPRPAEERARCNGDGRIQCFFHHTGGARFCGCSLLDASVEHDCQNPDWCAKTKATL